MDSFPPKNGKNIPWYILLMVLFGTSGGGGYKIVDDMFSIRGEVKKNQEEIVNLKNNIEALRRDLSTCSGTIDTILSNQKAMLIAINQRDDDPPRRRR